jgi:hypothetical protein
MEQHTTPPSDVEELHDFLNRAGRDAMGRAADPYAGTPTQKAFADSETNLIEKLATLITTDEDARGFVARWRMLVETAPPDQYPQRRGAVFGRTDEATWTIGAQMLRCAVTLFDALVADEIVKGYRVLGTVVED